MTEARKLGVPMPVSALCSEVVLSAMAPDTLTKTSPCSCWKWLEVRDW